MRRLKESLAGKAKVFLELNRSHHYSTQNWKHYFDYFPAEYLLVVNEEKNIAERAEHFYQEVFMEYELSSQQNKLTLSPESLFLTHRELESLS